jgi:hypothetical protein
VPGVLGRGRGRGRMQCAHDHHFHLHHRRSSVRLRGVRPGLSA